MQISKSELMRLVAHEVGHIIVAIATGTTVFSVKISTKSAGYKGMAGSVDWGKPADACEDTASIAVSGLVGELLADGKSPVDGWIQFASLFRNHPRFGNDLLYFTEAENQGYGLRNAINISTAIQTEWADRAKVLRDQLLKPENLNRKISTAELFAMCGITVLDVANKPIPKSRLNKFLKSILTNPQPCRYRMLPVGTY